MISKVYCQDTPHPDAAQTRLLQVTKELRILNILNNTSNTRINSSYVILDHHLDLYLYILLFFRLTILSKFHETYIMG